MKSIYLSLKNFLKDDFDTKSYAWLFLFLLLSIGLNYKYNFEDDIIDANFRDDWYYSLVYWCFYSFAFYGVVLPTLILRKQNDLFKTPKFWLFTSSTILVCSFLVAEDIPYEFFISDRWTKDEIFFFKKALTTGSTFLMSLFLIPVLIKISGYKEKLFYGITFNNVNILPYALMLFIMLIPLVWASYQNEFQEYYPTLKFWRLHHPFHLNKTTLGVTWEIVYAFSFIGTEILFRGAMVIGISKILGKNVILPAVAVYAFLHFGKPIAETIGSIFGGFILSVIALEKKNLIGGVLIHMGVAIGMDILSLAQRHHWMP